MLLLVSSECSPAALLWGEEPPRSKCPSPSITVFSEAVVVLVAVWLPGCPGVSRGGYHPAPPSFRLRPGLTTRAVAAGRAWHPVEVVSTDH